MATLRDLVHSRPLLRRQAPGQLHQDTPGSKANSASHTPKQLPFPQPFSQQIALFSGYLLSAPSPTSQIHAISLAPTWPLLIPLTPAMSVQASQVPPRTHEILLPPGLPYWLRRGMERTRSCSAMCPPSIQYQPHSKSGLRNVHEEDRHSQRPKSSGVASGAALWGWKGD